MVELVVVAGPSVGRSVSLDRGPVTVGSRAGSGLRLDDRAISGVHVEISRAPTGIRVRDLGSKNGVYVGEARIQEAVLAPGTILRLGRSEIALGAPEVPSCTLRESYGGLYGVSKPMQRIFCLLEKLEKSEATVLILGETGSGKELAARAIHDASPRRAGPFVVFDCAAVAHDILESELFGHVRGAFTGAVSDRVGAAEQANGGTLFLDEIGDLRLDLQPKLLRVIEGREIRRVGSTDTNKVDLRVVAATHRDLAAGVARGTFRQDLFFRLAVVQLKLPPLRERRQDVPLIAEQMMRAANQSPSKARHLAECVGRLTSYAWPGNCRELRNALDHLVALGEVPSQLGPSRPGAAQSSRPVTPYHDARAEAVEQFERAYVGSLFRESGGIIARAQQIAKIDRNVVRRLFRKYHAPEGRR